MLGVETTVQQQDLLEREIENGCLIFVVSLHLYIYIYIT